MWGEMRFSQPQRVRRGFTPQESYWMERIEAEARATKHKTARGLNGFVDVMKQECELGGERNLELPCCYIYKNSAVAQIEPTIWSNGNNTESTLLYMRKIYVLDSLRGEGIGTAFINHIKKSVDHAGMILFLNAQSFSLADSKDGRPYGFDSMDELLQHWNAEQLTGTDVTVLLKDWYRKQGFFNGCVHDEGEHKARRGESLDRQFIYIGENYSGDVEQIKRRAKAEGMCEICKDNFHLLHGEQGPEEKENG